MVVEGMGRWTYSLGGLENVFTPAPGLRGNFLHTTLARLVANVCDGPAIGVPSLFFFTLEIGRDLSRTGLTLRSAYLRHFVPQCHIEYLWVSLWVPSTMFQSLKYDMPHNLGSLKVEQ